ncbi:MAG: YtxH domain-containing protein [Thermodesulfovibrionales bacterium]|nr:YtxH domain-containing protein [Thermodesulfovibrionales bacterium]
MRHDEGHSAGTVVLSFLFGGVVGAGLALLLAPQSGRETRQKIREYADDVREKAEDIAEQVKEKMDSALHSGKDYVGEKKSIITAAIEAGKEAYEKEKEKHAK